MDQNKIQEMQILEQNLQNLLMQKQAFQMELSETVSALKEIEKSSEDVYKVIGQLMIKVSKDKIKEELNNQKMITMKQDGILKALSGITTLEEVMKASKD
ncbi:prefoldin subunit [Candidatus Babeliales bacterium]|nr:prefoldin subunit [Candidatus Babeliales bacterium]